MAWDRIGLIRKCSSARSTVRSIGAEARGATLFAHCSATFTLGAAGLLTGKYRDGAEPAASRAAVDRANGGKGDLGGRRTRRAAEAVAAWLALAAELALDPVHAAIAFTRQRPFPVIPIIGATDLAQLDHILAGLDLRLSEDALRRIAQFHRDHPMPF